MGVTFDADAVAAQLGRARERTLDLLSPLSDKQLVQQVSPLMSPLVWDFAHIGHFEELWLLRELGGEPPIRAEHDDVYDAFAHERSERAELPIMPPAAARSFVEDASAFSPSSKACPGRARTRCSKADTSSGW